MHKKSRPSGRPMQEVSFNTVDEFLEFLPEDERVITERLRKIVRNCIPEATEHLAYNVPFYKRNTNVCFIWPASVLWGKKKTYTGVRFGFSSGHLLTDEDGYLSRGNRKNVYWRDFTRLSEIDADVLKAFIFEAVLVDQEKARAKKKL